MASPLGQAVGAILATLAETPEGCPESTLYMGVGMDLDLWNTAKAVMIRTGAITESGHWVKATEKGARIGNEINAALNAAKRATSE